jgi:hypothetical protein
MKRIRIIGLCFAALFALSVIAVSSASALPEILFKFTNSNSPIANGGTFTAKGGGVLFDTINGSQFDCISSTGSGTFENAHLGKISLLLTECASGGGTCTSTGSKAGHITMSSLPFHLGLAHVGSNSTVPATIMLLPSGGIKFICNFGEVTLTGNLIGALQKLNGEEPRVGESFKEANLVYQQTGGKQELRLILLPLGGGTLEGQHLTWKILAGEEMALEFTETVKEFKNSKGEATEIELEAG